MGLRDLPSDMAYAIKRPGKLLGVVRSLVRGAEETATSTMRLTFVNFWTIGRNRRMGPLYCRFDLPRMAAT